MSGVGYHALLIANSNFPEDPSLADLIGPKNDPDVLRSALCDASTGLFGPDFVKILRDGREDEIRREIEGFLSNASMHDTVLLYYSGHGLRDLSGQLFLCARNTRSERLYSTAVGSNWISEVIEGSAAAVTIIILDCCHSGAFKGSDSAEGLSGHGRFVLASTRAAQLAMDSEGSGGNSPFTDTLVKGLTGGARDSDGDGLVTLDDLFSYVDGQLRSSGKQVPHKRFDGDGNPPIARRAGSAPTHDADFRTTSSPPGLYVFPLEINLGDIALYEDLPIERVAITMPNGQTPCWTAQASAPWVHVTADENGISLRLRPPPGTGRANVFVYDSSMHDIQTIRIRFRIQESPPGQPRPGEVSRGERGGVPLQAPVSRPLGHGTHRKLRVMGPDELDAEGLTTRPSQPSTQTPKLERRRGHYAALDASDADHEAPLTDSPEARGRAMASSSIHSEASPARSSHSDSYGGELQAAISSQPSDVPETILRRAARPSVRSWRVRGAGVLLLIAGIVVPVLLRGPSPVAKFFDGATITGIAFSPSGRGLVSGDEVGHGCLRQLAPKYSIHCFTDSQGVSIAVAFSPNGRIIATEDSLGVSYLWDAVNEHRIATLATPGARSGDIAPTVAFSPSGKMLAVDDGAGGVSLWKISTKKIIATFHVQNTFDNVQAVAFSPDGTRLAIGESSQDTAGIVDIYDVSTRLRVADLGLPPSSSDVQTISFSQSGKILAIGSANGPTYLRSIATGAKLGSFADPVSSPNVEVVAFDPNGKVLATGDKNGTCYIWDLATGKRVAAFSDSHSATVTAMEFNRDGSELAVGNDYGYIYLWNTSALK
jgi:WD40 repeat protein